MKYLAASNKSVGFLNFIVLFGTLYGLFTYDLTLEYLLLTLLFYFLYSGIGVGITLHRYYTHKSFEFKHRVIKELFTLLALMSARGSVIGWVYIHRMHHRYSDSETDPHIRNMSVLKVFFPFFSDHASTVNKFMIKDLLTKYQLNINQYYVAIVLTPVIILSLFSLKLAFFAWFLPVFLTSLIWNIFFWAGHSKNIGYRTHDTKDNSANSLLFAILTFGEGYHNNHHAFPSKFTTKLDKHEIDILGNIITLIGKPA
jgi:fatty-acid desaturase